MLTCNCCNRKVIEKPDPNRKELPFYYMYPQDESSELGYCRYCVEAYRSVTIKECLEDGNEVLALGYRNMGHAQLLHKLNLLVHDKKDHWVRVASLGSQRGQVLKHHFFSTTGNSPTKSNTGKDAPALKEIAPQEIYKAISRGIIGNERFKEVMSVAISKARSGFFNQPSVILVTGDSGTGKTELLRVIKKNVAIPLVSIGVKEITPNGYIGKNVTTIFADLIRAAGDNPKLAEDGIIHIDEIDKLYDGEKVGDLRVGIENALLTMVDGGEKVFMDEHKRERRLDTKRLTFVFTGSFSSVKNKKERSTIGVTRDEVEYGGTSEGAISRDDLRSVGMKDELIGRITNITYTERPNFESMHMFFDQSTFIKSLKDYFKRVWKYNFDIGEDLKRKFIDKALKEKLGYRHLVYQVNDYADKTIARRMQMALDKEEYTIRKQIEKTIEGSGIKKMLRTLSQAIF